MRDTRIQKAIADMGICSRRQAEQMILDGRVKVNGHPVKLGDKMDIARDVVSIDGVTMRPPRKRELKYYILNKPRGYITTASDDRGRKTVMELISDIPERVYPVGRLDKDSEGLLILTNDGALANALMHPSGKVSKMYRVTVHPKASEEQVVALTDGVVLDDGTKTLPAVIRVVADEDERTVMEMTIREGKNRQIRRMCEAVGLEVARLSRKQIGPIKLGMLKSGTYRELKPAEIQALRGAVQKGQSSSRGQSEKKRRSR
jgi:23S rRNA pseudouridine2605 synthase